jgi:iron complex transport system substrate-binding protein
MTAQRIVSLLPSATETLFDLGVGDRVVGVTHECDFPAEARTRPALTASTLPELLQTHPGTTPPAIADRAGRIDRHVRANVHGGSSLYHLDDAKLAALDPDLIVTQELCAVCAVSYEIVATAAKRLRGDPRVVSLEPSSLADVYANIRTLGDLTHASGEAERLVASLERRVETLRGRARGARPRTLVLEWPEPPMTGGHWTPGLVAIAGGEDVLGFPEAYSQAVSWQAIAEADPDVVILAPCGYDLDQARIAARELAAHPTWSTLRAVRERRAFIIDGNAYVNRPGPRLVDTAELFAACLFDEPLPPHAAERL